MLTDDAPLAGGGSGSPDDRGAPPPRVWPLRYTVEVGAYTATETTPAQGLAEALVLLPVRAEGAATRITTVAVDGTGAPLGPLPLWLAWVHLTGTLAQHPALPEDHRALCALLLAHLPTAYRARGRDE